MTSPYLNVFGIRYQDGTISLERIPYTPTSRTSVKQHVVLDGETIHSIAFKYYKDSGQWGVIADYNGIYDVFEEVVPGLTLYIPQL